MDADLVALLAQENHLPPEALRRAAREPERIAGPVLALIERAAVEPDALDEGEANLLFWGLHALAAARDPRLFAPLMRFLRQDGEALDGLMGDAVSETLPRVLASAYAGDADALGRLILDSTTDDSVRFSAFQAMGFLVRQGRFARETAAGLLARFDDARAAVEESPSWAGWEECIAYLGLADLAPRVEAARREGRLTDEVNDLPWFRRALRQANREPPDLSAFGEHHYGYLDDPVAALAWTAEDAGQPIKNPHKTVGRNDPCPCGSGKKFKKCCLNAPPPAAASAGLPL